MEGVGFFFNDWITDEQSPRIRRIAKLWHQDGQLIVEAEVVGTEGARLSVDDEGEIAGPYQRFSASRHAEGRARPRLGRRGRCEVGKERTIWVVARVQAGAARRR